MPDTASHLVFYNLDKLRRGDEVILEDRQCRAYRYRVSEAFEATPEDSWVMGQERDRDMLTLQTCIPPTFERRLVVRPTAPDSPPPPVSRFEDLRKKIS